MQSIYHYHLPGWLNMWFNPRRYRHDWKLQRDFSLHINLDCSLCLIKFVIYSYSKVARKSYAQYIPYYRLPVAHFLKIMVDVTGSVHVYFLLFIIIFAFFRKKYYIDIFCQCSFFLYYKNQINFLYFCISNSFIYLIVFTTFRVF